MIQPMRDEFAHPRVDVFRTWLPVFVLIIGTALALVVRWQLRMFTSGDFNIYFIKWYEKAQTGGFSLLAKGFTNYPPLYEFWLYIASNRLQFLPPEISIKLFSVPFDFLCAFFTYKIVQLKYGRGLAPALAWLAVLFSPTVVLNSAAWAQIDAVYTAFLVGCLYFLLRGRPSAAAICFGLAFSFKAQAIFFAPVLLIFWLKKQMPFKHLLLIPLVWLVSFAPSLIPGRPLGDLLTLYLKQSDQFPALQMNFPNLLAFIPDRFFNLLDGPMIILSAAAVLMFMALTCASKQKPTSEKMILAAVFCLILVPFMLPRMHDRYMFAADVISIALAFYMPRLLYVPVVVSAASTNAYVYYLWGVYPAPSGVFAAILLVLLVALTYQLLRELYPHLELK